MKLEQEKCEQRKLIYQGNILKLFKDQVSFPDGNNSSREVVEHNGGVSVLAEDKSGKILLIRQYRYPVKEVIYEIPAGKLEIGEEVIECAARELQEETGYQAEKLEKLFEFYPTPGYSSEKIYIYQASNLSYVGQNLDEGEYIEVVPKTKTELLELFKAGKLKDSKTLIAVMYYLGDF
ncbi:NUDIX domain-containing protein [Halanaerobium salsuginis]|jgi:ADP-ribose pyrophosphatase|uniref:ADP-ribose pyrophosphatase n=1 Tax=Halanaerobium salsuginis TaxID=29563 RepID=A0A1I4FFJ4_9FIRM|nr:NUDIX hydrolase [Halanaerobium salsuginis]SFL15566.1 ADP-ribose pyrophosphatase [Halanaerobium salsuginis]